MIPTIPHDKALHFIAGILLFAVGNVFSVSVGLALAFIYAIGKEVWDSFGNGTVDLYDALWTIGGGIVGYFIAATATI